MQPSWNLRTSTIEQEREFKRLTTLHQLTDTWVKTITTETKRPYQLERMEKVTLNQNVWLFEKARVDQLPLELNELTGAQEVESFLGDLRETIWIIQSSTIENALSLSSKPEEMVSFLKKATWNHGKTTAESIWSSTEIKDLVDAYFAFVESSVYGKSSFLLERKHASELTFIWTKSPYQHQSLMNSKALATLAALHTEWIMGFFYGLSRHIKSEPSETFISEKRAIRFSLLWTY